jgi:enoyl-CoA hydratase/carnithine racemase
LPFLPFLITNCDKLAHKECIMKYDRITTERKGHVFLMGLNRPDKYNAFDLDMYHELALAYNELDKDPGLRCGLLFAHGKNFTSGLELDKWAPVMAKGSMDIPDGGIHPLGLDEDNRVSKPVVMAIQGRCYTIGFELLLAQDMRVASKDARIALLEVTRGIYPVGGGTVRLFEEIGWGNAMRYLLTGDEISGEEAYRLGLVQEVVETDAVLDKALELAEKISKRAPLGVMAALKSARISRIEGTRKALERLLPDLQPILGSEDVKEGIASFLERREAKFTGK